MTKAAYGGAPVQAGGATKPNNRLQPTPSSVRCASASRRG